MIIVVNSDLSIILHLSLTKQDVCSYNCRQAERAAGQCLSFEHDSFVHRGIKISPALNPFAFTYLCM